MPRCNLWEDKLALFIEEKRNQPFNWQTNNCAFFACDWIAIVFGQDPAAPYRGMTGLQLSRAIRQTPVDKLAEKITMEIGWYCVTPVWARRGDIVEIALDSYPALGVCIGARSAFPGKDGIIFNKTIDCRRAWRVD